LTFIKINESINTSLSSLTKNQPDSFLKFRDKTSEVTESSLKRTTDSISKRFDDFSKSIDNHMININDKVEERLKDGFYQTNKVFSDIKDRLLLIDHAQKKISDLSTNVISLQETLDNKGARGAFGEVQLAEIIRDMIPEKYCKFQETISNGKRPDCIVLLPEPTGKLIIDAKFPLENYKFMYDRESSKQDKISAKSNFKRDIKKHIKDISEKYIIKGETANGAVMFIPSEAVFAEIHAHHPDLVKESQVKQVWLTSPSTLMALLTTIRAVIADDERSKQAKIIQNHLNSLSIEFGRFSIRMEKLSKHINMANDDVKQINITAGKITNKFGKIEQSELENLKPELLP
jgi:DNA recombination protein RmuC